MTRESSRSTLLRALLLGAIGWFTAVFGTMLVGAVTPWAASPVLRVAVGRCVGALQWIDGGPWTAR